MFEKLIGAFAAFIATPIIVGVHLIVGMHMATMLDPTGAVLLMIAASVMAGKMVIDVWTKALS